MMFMHIAPEVRQACGSRRSSCLQYRESGLSLHPHPSTFPLPHANYPCPPSPDDLRQRDAVHAQLWPRRDGDHAGRGQEEQRERRPGGGAAGGAAGPGLGPGAVPDTGSEPVPRQPVGRLTAPAPHLPRRPRTRRGGRRPTPALRALRWRLSRRAAPSWRRRSSCYASGSHMPRLQARGPAAPMERKPSAPTGRPAPPAAAGATVVASRPGAPAAPASRPTAAAWAAAAAAAPRRGAAQPLLAAPPACLG